MVRRSADIRQGPLAGSAPLWHTRRDFLPWSVPKEQFFYPATRELLTLLDRAAARSRVSRAEAFDDFLLMSVCALSGGQMEDQYMDTVKKHTEGEMGKRGCDAIVQTLARLVMIMEKTRQDVLGDLFQGAISHDENQQYLTPEPVAACMARLTTHLTSKINESPPTVWDPCCGSGRILLAAAEERRDSVFIGQDIDLRCVRMTCLNLALRNLYGYVVWGDTLMREAKRAYRTGFNGRAFIAEIPVESCPYPVTEIPSAPPMASPETPKKPKSTDDDHAPPGTQRMLF